MLRAEQLRNSRLPAFRLGDHGATTGEHLAQYQPVSLVIVDDQRLDAAQIGTHRRPCERRLFADRELSREVKGTSGSDDALGPYASLHQLDHAPRDGQTQSRTAEFARGRSIDLGVRREDQLARIVGNANARVANCEPHPPRGWIVRIALDADDYFALLGELDRVTDEVDEDLAQPRRISDQRLRHVGGDPKRELEPLLMRSYGHHFERLVQYLAEIEIEVLERQMT